MPRASWVSSWTFRILIRIPVLALLNRFVKAKARFTKKTMRGIPGENAAQCMAEIEGIG